MPPCAAAARSSARAAAMRCAAPSPCSRRGGRRRHPAAGNPSAAVELAHQAGDHRASDRVEARHRAGEIPQDLSAAARAGDAALDRARAHRSHRRSARPDRARLDDRRAASGEADGASTRSSRGLHFFDESLVRDGAGDASAWSMPRSSNIIPASSFELPPFLQFGSWIGGDRDGNPWRHHEVTAWTLRQNALACAAALPRADRRSGQGAVHHRARACRCRRASRPELDRALEASGEAEHDQDAQSRRALPPISLDRAAQARRHHRPRRGQDIGGPGAAYANADELILDLRVIETRAGGGEQPLDRRQSGQAGAPRGRDFPLLDRPARSPREHHQDHRRACRRCGGRRPATATTARPSSAAASGARGCSASWRGRSTGPRLIPELPAEAAELHRHVRPGGRDPARSSTATPSARSSCR